MFVGDLVTIREDKLHIVKRCNPKFYEAYIKNGFAKVYDSSIVEWACLTELEVEFIDDDLVKRTVRDSVEDGWLVPM